MSTVRFQSGAPAVAQVDEAVVGGTIENDDLFKATIGNKLLSVPAASTVAATVATNFQTAWNALASGQYPEFRNDITLNVVSDTISFTGPSSGKPFTLTLSTTEANGSASDGQTFVQTTTTAASGPNHWNTAANWDGNAVPVSGVDEEQTVTITGAPDGGTFTLTYSGQTTDPIPYNAAAATVETELEALSTIGAGNVSVTGSAGGPYTVTFIEDLGNQNVAAMTADGGNLTGGTDPDVEIATTQAGSAGDTVNLNNLNASILYGLSQSSVTLAALNLAATYTGFIGLPKTTTENAPYPEYREQYLCIGTSSLNLGTGEGAGSGRIKINNGSVKVIGHVYKTATAAENGVPAFLWKGTHAENEMHIHRGYVGIAFFNGETAALATLTIGYITSLLGDSKVVCGSGCTLGVIEQAGGTLTLNSGCTRLTMDGGEANVEAGNIATLTIGKSADASKSILYYNAAGTITIATLYDGAELNLSLDPRDKTITDLFMYKGSNFQDPNGTTLGRCGLHLVGCTEEEVTINRGKNIDIPATAS